MIVSNIELKNYRNYDSVKIDFSPKINVIIGKNAQGKTNLLEAIFFNAIGKSLRTNKDADLIKWSTTNAFIKTNIEKKHRNTHIDILFSLKEKKTIKINQIPIRKIGELLGELNCVYFSPDELKLIKESPEDRRRFMDIDISQTSKTYFYLLGKYEKILSMRNKILKNYKDKIKIIKTPKSYKIVDEESNLKNFEELTSMLDIYNVQLAEVGGKIIAFRQQFIINISPFASKAHAFLTSNEENLFLEYLTDVELENEMQLDSLFNVYKEKLLQKYDKNIAKDIYLAYTSIGPHRDDIKVLVNEIDIRNFGSQGQQRTTALSLKLAEIEIIKQQTGDIPILILDDVLSELDESRRYKLLKFCSKCQTFISATEFNEKLDLNNVKIITIQNGKAV